MRRIARILLNVLAVLSLLAIAATVISGFKPLSWSWGDPLTERGHSVRLTRGSLSYRRTSGIRRIVLTHQPGQPGQIGPSVLSQWHAFGFHFSRSVTVTYTLDGKLLPGTFGRHTELWVDSGWVLLASTPLPVYFAFVLALRGGRGRRRKAAGLCPSCGYDLRATPDRCPECGAAASNANARERKAAPAPL